jgi:hypothetical protein
MKTKLHMVSVTINGRRQTYFITFNADVKPYVPQDCMKYLPRGTTITTG